MWFAYPTGRQVHPVAPSQVRPCSGAIKARPLWGVPGQGLAPHKAHGEALIGAFTLEDGGERGHLPPWNGPNQREGVPKMPATPAINPPQHDLVGATYSPHSTDFGVIVFDGRCRRCWYEHARAALGKARAARRKAYAMPDDVEVTP